MKRNVFAIFLAVMLVAALVFVVAPSAKADSDLIYLDANNAITINETNKDKVLDLQGNKNAIVTFEVSAELKVIDTSFMVWNDEHSDYTIDFSGDNAGILTVVNAEGVTGDIAPCPKYGDYRYLMVENTDENNNPTGTYSFHPFNMAISGVGINTLAHHEVNGETVMRPEVCVRVTFIANDVVKGKLVGYGLYNKTTEKPMAIVSGKYSLEGKNAVHSYFDLTYSLNADKIDVANTFCGYMQFEGDSNGNTIYSSAIEITPREVLKSINKKSDIKITEAQLERIHTLMGSNSRVNNILERFRVAQTTADLSFADKAQRTEYSTTKQVWTQNGITLTNNKSDSSTNVGDYSNPARFYKGSEIVIEASGMTKITFSVVPDDKNPLTNFTTLITVGGNISSSTTDGNNVTVEFVKPIDKFTLSCTVGQVRLSSIAVTSGSPDCTHESSSAKCTADGICDDCDETVSALGHTKIAATCKEPEKCSVCNEVLGTEVDKNAHNYEDGKCTICGDVKATVDPVWTLVTDISQIKVGSQIVIVAKGSNVAMSTTQNSNNRGQIAITKNGSTLTINNNVQIFTVEAGTSDGTFAFNTGTGYIYAASTSSNHLKTKAAKDASGSWNVTVTSAGIATVKSVGNTSKGWMRYNSSSKLFSCYASGQADIAIYVLQ